MKIQRNIIQIMCKNCAHTFHLDITFMPYSLHDIVANNEEGKNFWQKTIECPSCNRPTFPRITYYDTGAGDLIRERLERMNKKD